MPLTWTVEQYHAYLRLPRKGEGEIMMHDEEADISELVGHVVMKVDVAQGAARIALTIEEGTVYTLAHYRDCSETVELIDIDGSLDDLIGQRVLVAEKRTNTGDPPPPGNWHDRSRLWTFYTVRTVKSSVTMRWYGESNGYYSLEVDCVKYWDDE